MKIPIVGSLFWIKYYLC